MARTELEIMSKWRSKTSPVVSVVCITYNHEKYIVEAIHSFLMQETDFPFEIIIGEDCSPDNTRKILDEYVAKYPQLIRLITYDNNVGMYQNFINCLREASGKYIALCEGDDYWMYSKKLQKQVDLLEKNTSCNICFHPAVMETGGMLNGLCGNYTARASSRLFSAKEILSGSVKFMPTASMLFRQNVLSDIEIFLEKGGQLWDYSLQILASLPNGALFINHPMAVYRVASESSVTAKWSVSFETLLKVRKEIERTLLLIDQMNIGNKYHRYFLRAVSKSYCDLLKDRTLSMVDKMNFLENYSSKILFYHKIIWILFYKNEIVRSGLKKIRNMILRR